MYNSTLILHNAEFIKNDKFSLIFTNCKMSSEFIILLFAESHTNCKMSLKCLQNDENLQNFIRIHHFEEILQFASDSAECGIINSDDILQFAKFIENLSFSINSALCKIKVELYILIRF